MCHNETPAYYLCTYQVTTRSGSTITVKIDNWHACHCVEIGFLGNTIMGFGILGQEWPSGF